jgi:hypothetical protein
MNRQAFHLLVLVGLLLTACGAERGTEEPLAAASNGFPSCEEVPVITAPPGAYRDTPIYVENEMPIEEVQAWAAAQPGYEGIWIDREHNGWLAVAFSENAADRQADLEVMFPDDGVVAVEVDYTADELAALQARVGEELSEILDSYATGSYENKGVVGIDVGVLTPEILTEIDERFEGEPICVDGRDPSTVPAPGPQPQEGEGWRLLADEAPAGEPYRTGIASDAGSLSELWTRIGLDAPVPEVDFESEVVIWFGAVYGSSCPDIRLDDVVVDGTIVHAVIVMPNPPVACTDDANPHAYVVALERAKLPAGPFVIQLGPDDPPAGVPEERTVVDVDLSRPGAVAGPDDIGQDPGLPGPQYVESGDIIETGFARPYRLYIHCGIEWLGEFNGLNWRTDDPMPPEWTGAKLIDFETIEVEITLSTGNPPQIDATANGATVTYIPSDEAVPGCD